ncbi:lysophospholipase L1-like esterase [Pontibacter ummariensis]|uniref:Lysophospholipase L1 n=1 Tax=Pontibacter ummariensis TaxID=1610492 RepID=A0A239H7W6_9BACT|nr:GDSL-type esterase/lipase family protein [Pontibacter ummariensis]PRY10725.1 lysophospholipase L1-like esterase [Pontibacter ummariensis]SNS77261.1 Lysophospholipase L1 [Pontibacter ummariensis]
MKRLVTLVLVFGLVLLHTFHVFAQATVKVACVGNSITEGAGLETTYPEALQALLGDAYEVRNYGVSGRTLLKKGDFPYWKEAKYQEALAWNPDIVVIKLGTNDSKPQNWIYSEDFVKDYVKLVKSFKKLPAKPEVFLAYPIPVFEDKWGINEAIVKNQVIPAVKKIARKANVKTIDLYTPFTGQAGLTYDGVHPNEEGAALLAKEVYQELVANEAASVK